MIHQAVGPRGWPWIGSLPAFVRDPLRFWTRLANGYGGVARYRIGAEQHFLISDPQGIAHIFRHDTVRYYRGKYHDLLKPAFGEGLLTSNDEPWRQQRRLIQPLLTKQRVSNWLDIVVSATAATIEAWGDRRDEAPVDFFEGMARLVQEINAKVLFGRALPYQAQPALLSSVSAINGSLLRQVKRAMIWDGMLNRLPLPDVRRFRAAANTLHRTVDRLTAESRPQVDDDSLYGGLTRAANETGSPPETFKIRDQLITLFLAGHETTAVALAWIFYFLTEHSPWSERLHGEISTVLGDRTPTLADLNRLVLTRQVIDESLRLRPPVYAIGRRARVDDEVCGCRIPAESPVVVSPYVMHHHPAYWHEPERFEPERFEPDRVATRPAFCYFPFGGGPHVCVGQHLGMMELLAVVAMVVRDFRLTAPPGRRVALQPWITLRPKPDVRLFLARR
ncbi:MAG: cytochrome P450 [bacterium]|nr:cytochrome P450 [bacterium]